MKNKQYLIGWVGFLIFSFFVALPNRRWLHQVNMSYLSMTA
ncbi:hypothetical protein EFM7_0437 [Enterococcus faecalis M7]|nr:hypothetical protein OG1X_0897 [Enterococcus faecalis OG1X]ELA06281.1 hypothetical protein EFM7_0437 [Enterococcus faecalis M7]